MSWPWETKTSTCRNFATISSGLYRFLAIAVLLDVDTYLKSDHFVGGGSWLIAYFPPILGLGIDNIRGRIADLRELGFSDPVQMITSGPTILGLAIDNIRGRI